MSSPCRFIVKEGYRDYYCMICNYYVYGHESVHYHASGECHGIALNDYGCDIEESEYNHYYCSRCDCTVPGYENVYDHLTGRRHESLLHEEEEEEDYADYEDYEYYEDDYNEGPWPSQSFVCDFVSRESYEEYYCVLCGCDLFGYANFMDHVNSKGHGHFVDKYGLDISPCNYENDLYYCSTCDCSIPGYNNIYSHIMGKRHQGLACDDDGEEAKLTEIDWSDCQYFECPFVLKEDCGIYYCLICGQQIHGHYSYENHVAGYSHKNGVESHGNHVSPLGNDDFYCSGCNCKISCYRNVYKHLIGQRHRGMVGERKKSETAVREAEKWKKEAESLKSEMEKAEKCKEEKRKIAEEWRQKAKNLESEIEKAEKWREKAKSLESEIEKAEKWREKVKSLESEIEKAEKWREKAKNLESEIEKAEKWREKAKSLESEIEKAEKWREKVKSLESEIEKAEKWKDERKKAEKWESEKREAEKWEVEKREAERWKAEKREAERWKIERELAENWRAEKEEAEKWRLDKEKMRAEMEKLKAEELKAEGEKAEELKAEGEKAEELKAEKEEAESWHEKIKMEEQRARPQKVHQASDQLKTLDSPKSMTSSSSDKLDGSTGITGTKISEKSINPNLQLKPVKFASSNSNTTQQKSEDSGATSRAPWMTKEGMKKFLNLLDYENDIYEMRDKVRETKLSMELSLVNDKKNIYCLVCRQTIETGSYSEHLCDLDHCEYLEGMEKDHALFELVPGQFSDLCLAYQYMEEDSEDSIRCLVCKKDLASENQILQRHIDDEEHRKCREDMRLRVKQNFDTVTSRMRCDWYSVLNYRCVPCDEMFNTEIKFFEHSRNKKHEKLLKKIESNERSLIYDYCAICSLLWYGYRSTYAYHCDSSSHKWHVRNGTSLTPELPKSAKRLLIESEKYIESTVRYLEDVKEKERKRDSLLIEDLGNLTKCRFPRVRAHAFGPRVSGLGSPDSNVCVFIDCGDMYDGKVSSSDQILDFMTTVHKSLSDNSELWITEKISTSNQNYSFRAHHRRTGLPCEISFENGLVVETTQLVKSFNDKFPSCRKLIIFLNQWLTFCNLSGSEPVSSYALEWCVIFYLQKKSILPSVASLIAKKNMSREISGWEVGVSDEFTCGSTSTNVKELLVGFFAFYANFDYRYDVACPLIGETVGKREFTSMKKLPREMKLYVDRVNNSPDYQPLGVDSVMCLQDPFDLSHNRTSAIGKADLSRFRTYCSKSFDFLRSS